MLLLTHRWILKETTPYGEKHSGMDSEKWRQKIVPRYLILFQLATRRDKVGSQSQFGSGGFTIGWNLWACVELGRLWNPELFNKSWRICIYDQLMWLNVCVWTSRKTVPREQGRIRKNCEYFMGVCFQFHISASSLLTAVTRWLVTKQHLETVIFSSRVPEVNQNVLCEHWLLRGRRLQHQRQKNKTNLFMSEL